MNIGVIGGSIGNMSGLVSAMVSNMMPQVEMFKMSFCYEDQYLSKIYEVNSRNTRGDFVQLVAEKGYDYIDQDAVSFVNKSEMNIFKVERI